MYIQQCLIYQHKLFGLTSLPCAEANTTVPILPRQQNMAQCRGAATSKATLHQNGDHKAWCILNTMLRLYRMAVYAGLLSYT